MDKIDRIKELVETLNYHRDLYYNQSQTEISDLEYDNLFDELTKLENETGFVLSGSPTSTVGYEVKDGLTKVTHSHPMLSLGKTKDLNEISKFFGAHKGVIMGKLDGLTATILYQNGKLVSAETRGNGIIGEDVTHNIKVIENVPLTIPCQDEVVIDGEVIIPLDVFDKINSNLPEDEQYKNARNLASGSLRQLDSKAAKERGMKFIAWKVIKGCDDNSFINRWNFMDELGFETVPLIEIPANTPVDRLEIGVNLIKQACKSYNYKIDGCVFGYDDISYGDSLGATEHHLNSQIAYKFYDELYDTRLLDVQWQVGRTGVLSPVAVFDPVEIDGCTINKATLHNVSYIYALGLRIGATIHVFKANDVIPRVDSCENDGISEIELPKICPICGGKVDFCVSDTGSQTLQCTNDECSAKQIAKFVHFVSKDCANIEGLSESTIEKFINKGFLKTFEDIYDLPKHKNEIITMDGFGEKSYNRLIEAIEKSKNITLSRYINALGIPLIGKKAAKTLSKAFKGDSDKFVIACEEDDFDFISLDDFGENMTQSLKTYKDEIWGLVGDRFNFLPEYQENEQSTNHSLISNKNICITGSLKTGNRDDLIAKIEASGGNFVSSVNKKTDYLVNNDINSSSSKNKKAKELNIPIITEDELLNMLKE